MASEWEYKDFVWTNPVLKEGYASVDALATMRFEWWTQMRSSIMGEIQKWLDEGWEPMTEIGPECWEVEDSKLPAVSRWGAFQWLFWFFSLIPTVGLSLLLLFQTYPVFRPVSFRVKMRRQPKENIAAALAATTLGAGTIDSLRSMYGKSVAQLIEAFESAANEADAAKVHWVVLDKKDAWTQAERDMFHQRMESIAGLDDIPDWKRRQAKYLAVESSPD